MSIVTTSREKGSLVYRDKKDGTGEYVEVSLANGTYVGRIEGILDFPNEMENHCNIRHNGVIVAQFWRK